MLFVFIVCWLTSLRVQCLARILSACRHHVHNSDALAQLSRPKPHHSEDTKEKISQTLMGHDVTQETKTKMSNHIKTKEHRLKLSLAKLGKSRVFTSEHRAKIAATKLSNKLKRILDNNHPIC